MVPKSGQIVQKSASRAFVCGLSNRAVAGYLKSTVPHYFFHTFWVLRASLRRHFGPTWRQMAAQGGQNGGPIRQENGAKIDAEKVSKNHGKRNQSADPRRCEADRVVRGRFTSPLPPSTGAPSPKRPKKVKWWKK